MFKIGVCSPTFEIIFLSMKLRNNKSTTTKGLLDPFKNASLLTHARHNLFDLAVPSNHLFFAILERLQDFKKMYYYYFDQF